MRGPADIGQCEQPADVYGRSLGRARAPPGLPAVEQHHGSNEQRRQHEHGDRTVRPAATPGEVLAEQEAERVDVGQVGGDDEGGHPEAGLLLEAGFPERCTCQTVGEIIQAGPFSACRT